MKGEYTQNVPISGDEDHLSSTGERCESSRSSRSIDRRTTTGVRRRVDRRKIHSFDRSFRQMALCRRHLLRRHYENIRFFNLTVLLAFSICNPQKIRITLELIININCNLSHPCNRTCEAPFFRRRGGAISRVTVVESNTCLSMLSMFAATFHQRIVFQITSIGSTTSERFFATVMSNSYVVVWDTHTFLKVFFSNLIQY